MEEFVGLKKLQNGVPRREASLSVLSLSDRTIAIQSGEATSKKYFQAPYLAPSSSADDRFAMHRDGCRRTADRVAEVDTAHGE